ncbi:DUF3043 domain-containing protein [Actinomyces sp. B33]|uniref:DUF3043 domain-containing protein n=1 Tax=Actinomyces sp. B33 TaxID=2942131 RepID=UPI0023421AAE|nr:DUF3043 domain-containing protein [Actinomyces sp. B33]MDC4232931.1 DUF3043 domain-containing protein [Actinomyces sp. B33]
MSSTNKSPDQTAARGKGRPTPTRKQAEARRSKPLVPADRKEAKRLAKARRDEQFRREQVALETGDERYLPARDKGRVRRFIRDWVDARWSFSEFILPVMVLFLVVMMAVSLVPSLQGDVAGRVMIVVTGAMYGLFAVSIVEGVVVWRRLRRRLAERYPGDAIVSGTWYYCFSRMIMARRWRTPRPQVSRGEFPGRAGA